MTTVTIASFRGIDASLELGDPITLVCGPNGAGKTRIAQALGAVLANDPLPLTGKRGDLKRVLTKDGPDQASVHLNSQDSIRRVLWPSGEVSAKGEQEAFPKVSRWTSGLGLGKRKLSVLDLDGKERAQAFADIFRTEPSENDLAKALKKRELSDHLGPVWETIEISGWDAATKHAENNARTLKGAWNEATGATWGEKVGEIWEPDSTRFPDDKELQEQLRVAEENLEHAKEHLVAMKEARAELPEPLESQKVYPCAHCGNLNVFEFGKLVKAENAHQLNSEELRNGRLAIASADGKVANAQDQVYHHQRAVGAARTRLNDAAEAKSKAKARAADLHRQIMEQLEIAQVCGPKGLRKAKLDHVLDKVNDSLAALAKEIGLPLVEIDAELEVAMDGTPYDDLSRAEQWIAQTIMQLEIARRDGSTMVVIDDLDVPIDPKDRNAVLQALHASGIKAAVMLAARSPDPRYAPDLGEAGLGSTFWIDRTHGLRPIGEAVKQGQKAA